MRAAAEPGTDVTPDDSLSGVISPKKLADKIAAAGTRITELRAALQWGRDCIRSSFNEGVAARSLVAANAGLTDRLLVHCWKQTVGDAPSVALVAVGGYGRGELLPYSDVDLLILHAGDSPGEAAQPLEQFLMLLWDLKLEVGHSVRSVTECVRQARDDVTVMTNLMESRLLCGAADLHTRMNAETTPEQLWPVTEYFRAKQAEQRARHAKYDETGYKLEPNIKESPGGLRDIHTILWVAKRLYPGATLENLVDLDLLTHPELSELSAGQDFLWRVRFALHLTADRHEDRLLFDTQVQIATLFGFVDQSHNRGVEQFMQLYYRQIKALSCMNDLLLQAFEERLFHPAQEQAPTPVNRRFQIRNNVLQTRDPDVFRRTPHALLEVFLLLQKHPELDGVDSATLRLIRRDRKLMTDRVRNDIRTKSLFMEILRQPEGVTHALRRMHRYGVLGRYLPNFGQIIGRMQFDLFHTLTVDEHTLFLVRNMRRLAVPRFHDEHPFFSDVAGRIAKPDVLYLAGLFHDIAKGRGGDHSELGAEDAIAFGESHGLPQRDIDLIAWLVRNHLLMSMTAQRKDLSDPAVIQEFTELMETRTRLDYLLLLTMCDIRATNPALWNSWRETLLKQLYNSSCRLLARGLENPIEINELVAEAQTATREFLRTTHYEHNVDTAALDALWSRCEDDYFLRFEPEELAWHARKIADHGIPADGNPLVRLKVDMDRGATLFVHMRDRVNLFAVTTAVLDKLGLTILEARLENTTDGYTLDSYGLAEGNGSHLTDPVRVEEVCEQLRALLSDSSVSDVKVSQRLSRQARAFTTPTQIYFSQDTERERTIMELVTADRPGLLSIVGRVFAKRGIQVVAAKIGTIGERAEDVFFIADANNKPLSDHALLHELRAVLTRTLQRGEPDTAPTSEITI